MSDYTPPNRYQPFPADPPGIVEQIEQLDQGNHPNEEQRERLRRQLEQGLTAEDLLRIEQTNQRR